MAYWTNDLTHQLITLVRVNPGLYTKGVYKDLQSKNHAWAQVGSRLDPPCSGDEASRRFKNLRDVFTRELRKLELPKSGESGFESEYHSPSQMFSELSFLKDHITGRRCRRRSNLKLQQADNFTMDLPGIVSDCKIMQTGQDREIDEHMASTLSQHSSLQSSLASPLIIGDFTAVGEVDAGILTSQLTSTPSQHFTASSDSCKQETKPSKSGRPYGTNDDYLRQCLDTLTELAAQICESMSNSPSSSQATTLDPFAGIVSYGIGFVPEERRLRCIIDVLKVVESYRKGVNITVLEEK